MFVAGPVAVSTPAKLVSPGYVINGTMSVTKSELYFEMDDEDEENKKIDPKVGAFMLSSAKVLKPDLTLEMLRRLNRFF